MREDMTSFIERLPIVEQRFGVSLAGLYAYGDGEYTYAFDVFGSSFTHTLSQDHTVSS